MVPSLKERHVYIWSFMYAGFGPRMSWVPTISEHLDGLGLFTDVYNVLIVMLLMTRPNAQARVPRVGLETPVSRAARINFISLAGRIVRLNLQSLHRVHKDQIMQCTKSFIN